VWGLPCPLHYCSGGALLPHHFTLTLPFCSGLCRLREAGAEQQGGIFSVALSVERSSQSAEAEN